MELTSQEVELLAGILQRAGITPIEAIWVNSVMNRLRQIALEKNLEEKVEPKKEPLNPPEL